MDLYDILWTKPDTSYSRPKPLHIYVVAVMDQSRVVSWEFTDNTAKPHVQKNNMIAAISDGKTVAKITVYEEFANKLREGNNYVIRGYAVRGQSPPYILTVTKDTQIFRSGTVSMTENLIDEGKALLQPPSPRTPLKECTDTKGFMSIEGEVIEVSTVKKVQMGKEAIPLKNVTLQKDSTRVALSLWREAAIEDLQLGSHIRVSHLKGRQGGYGLQLQSTNYTKFETVNTETDTITKVVGVMESATPGMLDLLSATDDIYTIEKTKWELFEDELCKGSLRIKASGGLVTEIERVTPKI